MHLTLHSQVNLQMDGCGEGKCNVYFRAPSKECRQLVFKRPKTFRKRFQSEVEEGALLSV